MDPKGCKFVRYWWEKVLQLVVPLTNNIYITFRLREETSKA